MAMDSDAAKLFLSNPSAVNARVRIEALQAIRDVSEKLDHKSIKVIIVQLVRGLFLYKFVCVTLGVTLVQHIVPVLQ
jgi:hypothetical protein